MQMKKDSRPRCGRTKPSVLQLPSEIVCLNSLDHPPQGSPRLRVAYEFVVCIRIERFALLLARSFTYFQITVGHDLTYPAPAQDRRREREVGRGEQTFTGSSPVK